MSCPLCKLRKARRACPALQQQICAVCCATKRLTEIACPPDCAYLASARQHPPAAAVRQQHRDAALVMRLVEDFNQRQSELVVVAARALISYEPPPFQSLTDADIAEAVSALAATSETAGRGVIYEHRPASGPGAHLASALTAVLTEAGAYRDSAIERDLASALRRLEAILAETRTAESARGSSGFLTFLRRILVAPAAAERPSNDADRVPRLIVS